MEIEEVDIAFADVMMTKYGFSEKALRDLLALAMNQTRQGHVCFQCDEFEPLMQFKGLVYREKERMYFQKYWKLETSILQAICLDSDATIRYPPPDALKALNDKQQLAIARALNHKLFILTGGPGTGKTYTAKQIVHAHKALKAERIALAAPTGKALAKLKASISHTCDAMTLHALLNIKKPEDFYKNSGFLPYSLIVVDEGSMMDIRMWCKLLTSCAPSTYLVILGDPDQLPPIEPGQIFADLVQFCRLHKKSCMVHLEKCVRTDQTLLIDLAMAVQRGDKEAFLKLAVDYQEKLPDIPTLCMEIHPYFRQTLSGSQAQEDFLQFLAHGQILTPLRLGPYGADALNIKIWDQISADLKTGDIIAVPIMVTCNARSLGLSNGDMGIWIHRISDSTKKLMRSEEDKVIFHQGEMAMAIAPSFDLAYAISVHKSQGSEYQRVHILMPPGSDRFGKKMLYTAITRARAELTISGPWDTIQSCIEHDPNRRSGIGERLK